MSNCSVVYKNRFDPRYGMLILIVLASCSGRKRYANTPIATNRQPATDTVSIHSQVPPPSRQYRIADAGNREVALIGLGDPASIRTGATTLSRVIRNGKSKYRDANNRNIYEIKYSDDGFKLRDESGNLIWKLKYKEGKLKIADNEEMTNPYEVKKKGDVAVITRNDQPVASFDLGGGAGPAIIKAGGNPLTVTGPDKNPVFALLGLSGIPQDQQLVLITEVLIAGR